MTFEQNIGGAMEVLPTDLLHPVRDGAWPAFPGLEAVRCDTGRSALRIALHDWRQRTGAQGRLWLPDFVCPSIVQTARDCGLTVASYADRPGDEGFETAPEPADDDIVLIVHFFGKCNEAALSWVAAHPQRTWRLIEDCVQSPYSAGVGVHADYVITSLRKWWAAPDGATLHHRGPAPSLELEAPDEAFVSQRLAAQMLRAAKRGEAHYLEWIARSEHRLEHAPARRCSWLSTQMLMTADARASAKRRRSNWHTLHALLYNLRLKLSYVSPLNHCLGSDEVPLAYPIRVGLGHRDRLRDWLRQQRIFCPVHWQIEGPASPRSLQLADEILSIPIDQRYDSAEMDLIIAALIDFSKQEHHA